MVPFLPSDLIDVLKWISPDPMAWFIGQFVKFILRPKPWLEKELDQLKKFHPGMYLYYLCKGNSFLSNFFYRFQPKS